ncbi:MAG: hypothetical protein D6769_03500 [Methanobacteriota archaeon]|nr:MAG: hypothetical protein D6769_03500 [Euryarchaeota archaeon]
MEYRVVFSFLLLIAVANAQSLQELFFADSLPTIALLFVVSAAIIAIIYIFGKLTKPQWVVLAKTEVWQLALTLMMFVTYSSLLLGFQQLLAVQTGQNNMITYVLDRMVFYENQLKSSIVASANKQYDFLVKGSVYVPALTAISPFSASFLTSLGIAEASMALSCVATFPTYWYCLSMGTLNYVTSIPSAITVTLSLSPYYNFRTYSDMVSIVISQYANFAETLLIPNRIIFSFLFEDLLPLIPLMAVILRLLPWTRQAGNMLFTLVFAFGAVFPFLLATFYGIFDASHPVSTLCSTSGVKEHFVFGPFTDCENIPYSIPTLVSYYPLILVIPSLALAISLTFATNFNKVFDYFKGAS